MNGTVTRPQRPDGMSRAQHRLDIARGLLGLAQGADVMATIQRLSEARSDELRGLVDWVEDFDLGEPA